MIFKLSPMERIGITIDREDLFLFWRPERNPTLYNLHKDRISWTSPYDNINREDL